MAAAAGGGGGGGGSAGPSAGSDAAVSVRGAASTSVGGPDEWCCDGAGDRVVTDVAVPAGRALRSDLLWNDDEGGEVSKWLQSFDALRRQEYEEGLAAARAKKKAAKARRQRRLRRRRRAGRGDDSSSGSASSGSGGSGSGSGSASSSASSSDGSGSDANKDEENAPISLFEAYRVPVEDADGTPVAPSELPICIPALQQHLFREGRLDEKDLLKLVRKATEAFALEPNLVDVAAPITVCGDVHGQFYDLVKLFTVGGPPATTRYLFLGDYVDRGSFSMECVILLYAFKVCYPHTFFMIRGNHECRHLTAYFTFKQEVLTKYSQEVYDAVMDSFDALPLSALLNQQFLCVHGGISPEIETLDDIRAIDRFCEPPQSGPMCDMLWADPMEDGDFEAADSPPFVENDSRGCSYVFSHGAVCSFLDRNDLLSVIRAHEAQDHGYRMHTRSAATGFPSVITLFSAPNYLDQYGNKGAVLRYDSNVMNIRQFNSSPHPYWLPSFLNVFHWSLPFCAEKVHEILLSVLRLCDDDAEEKKEIRMDRIRAKVLAMSRLMRMYSVLVSERETLLRIKAFSPDEKIPAGLLVGGADAIHKALGDFERAKQLDANNEKRPAVLEDEEQAAEEGGASADGAAPAAAATEAAGVKSARPPPAMKKAQSARSIFAQKNTFLQRLTASQEFKAESIREAQERMARASRRAASGTSSPAEGPSSPDLRVNDAHPKPLPNDGGSTSAAAAGFDAKK